MTSRQRARPADTVLGVGWPTPRGELEQGGMRTPQLPTALVGDGLGVPCLDGEERPYLNLDAAASTSSLPSVAARVHGFLPWYASVHRGAGYKSREATRAYEHARTSMLAFAGRGGADGDVAIICRNTTEAINHLAYRLRFNKEDVVVTTVVEHHANLLPWGRVARLGFVECDGDGTFDRDAVIAALDTRPAPRLLAVTGASNVTGWMPKVDDLIESAHERGIPVLVDAAQLAPHRALPATADYLVWSGHKMYAPFGAGVLIGPRATSRSVTRSSPVAARSTSSISMKLPGPPHPIGRRPAHPTSSAPSRSMRRSRRSAESGGRRSRITTTSWLMRSARA